MTVMESVQALKMINRRRINPSTTPEWWDRDCRCCMADTTGNLFSRRSMKGGVKVLNFEGLTGEVVHEWHTDAELTVWLDIELKRQNA